MDINYKDVSLNTYQALKEISEALDQFNDAEIKAEHAIDLIEDSLMNYQPLSSSCCLAEAFGNNIKDD